ncbi:MAG: hypothetical protein GXO27_06285 [Chlorobi bacterium]|nr:hypothetical protein [Chlorobiota bacterium]
MKSKYWRRGIIVSLVLLFMASTCKKEDPFIEYTPRDRAEQYAAEKDSILQFLQTHTYIVDAYGKVIIEPVRHAGQRTLYDDALVVQMEDPEDEEVVYDIYYLSVTPGTADSITTTDHVLAAVEIQNFDLETVFKRTELSPVWMNVWYPSAGIRLVGLRKVLPQFRGGTYTPNPDGTVTFEGKGVGVAFLPSGLAQFDLAFMGESGALLSSYSPVIVHFRTLVVNTDLDDDLVPNVLEDLNGNGDPTDDNTDKELEEKYGIPAHPDYVDPDDDGDGLLTKYEDTNGDGDPTNDDDDGDGIPNYLDADTH